jgi:aryl-alcohol dehydrogenase-like predicted oxidoreductase
MERRQVGASPLKASILGLGALHFGAYLGETESIDLIHRAHDAGINLIDTGPLYGNGDSEAIVGRAIKGRRDRFLITTKAGLARRVLDDGSFGVEVVALTREEIRRALESSLRAIGTDYIDLFQLHAFDPTTPLEESLEALSALLREGSIRAIGISNYDPGELGRAIRVVATNRCAPIAALECHYNLIERRAEAEILPLCKTAGIGLIPYRALARGILTGKYREGRPLPEKSRAADSWRVRRGLAGETLRLVAELETFAASYGRTMTELALAWLLANQQVPTILFGARNRTQLELCVGAAEWRLTTDDLLKMDQIVSGQNQLDRVRSLPDTFFEK